MIYNGDFPVNVKMPVRNKEKAAKKVGPTFKKVDLLDLEAEAEGNAIRRMKTSFSSGNNPVLGRRLVRQGVKESRGRTMIGNKRVVNLTKDHNAAREKYIIGSE